MNANLYALFESHFPAAPNSHALRPRRSGRPLRRPGRRVRAVANALVAAGCRPGDRVAVQADKHWHVFRSTWACLRAGLVYLPLNTGYQRAELGYFFGDAQPRVIVCGPDSSASIARWSARPTVLTLDERSIARASARTQFDTVTSPPDDLAAILYTSGTTGRSKGAMLTHRNLASNALALVDAWGFTRGDVLLHALPIFHVHGLFVAMHCALLSGSAHAVAAEIRRAEVVSLLPRATVMMGVPTFYTRLLAEPAFGRDACAIVRLFVSGSAPLLADTFDAVRSAHRATDPRALRDVRNGDDHVESARRRADRRHRRLAAARRRLRIVGDDGQPCAPATIGSIEIRGPNVFAGYWRMPEKTREEFTADGFFSTGDMGQWVPEGGAAICVVGRAKDLIITGGLNVYPKEIEERIDADARRGRVARSSACPTPTSAKR